MITPELMQAILAQYQLSTMGVHGVPHWARVLENGRCLASVTHAKLEVVELFAVFHDSRRLNEHIDHKHGHRGADLASEMRSTYFQLDDEDFQILYTACDRHTDGQVDGDITVQTCWDSDRLDLGRVWISPKPHRLCTEAARNVDIISWAYRRSRRKNIPDLIETEWGIVL